MELFFSQDIDGGLLKLDPEESGHCVRVLRHRTGDAISVIDGRGTMYDCVLVDADPKGAVARVTEAHEGFGAHPYRLTMAVCPTKNIDRYEWFAEKATEIGVDVIAPVIGDRSERRVIKTERLERLVRSAAKQSLKGAVPEIAAPVSVKEFIVSAPDNALKMICYCFDGDKHSITELLSSYTDATGEFLLPPVRKGQSRPEEFSGRPESVPEICILIGPEGDFSPEEAEMALSRGWVPVTLGASRLRTETAAIVAVTQVYSSL